MKKPKKRNLLALHAPMFDTYIRNFSFFVFREKRTQQSVHKSRFECSHSSNICCSPLFVVNRVTLYLIVIEATTIIIEEREWRRRQNIYKNFPHLFSFHLLASIDKDWNCMSHRHLSFIERLNWIYCWMFVWIVRSINGAEQLMWCDIYEI